MKTVRIISDEDDYFARDALIGQIRHHRNDIDFSDDRSVDGVVFIAGANMVQKGTVAERLTPHADNSLPLLVLITHAQNEDTVKAAAPNLPCAVWSQEAIDRFLETL